MFTRAWAGTVLAVVAVGVAGADNPMGQDEAVVTRVELEGVWATISFTFDGTFESSVLSSTTPAFSFVFKGDRFSQRLGEDWVSGHFTALAAGKGGDIDLMFFAGVRRPGIFRFDGPDRLTLCLRGKDRPTEFESKPGSGRLLVVLKRLKP
jgi:uncharacterized protein (TIGR03067 family)